MMLSETVLLSSKIINWLRLVLPYRWSRHSYCSFPALIELGFLWQQSCDQGGKFVRILHVIKEVTIDTCDIHQIKENAEVKSNRSFSIQTICGSTLVDKINSTHAAIVKLDELRTRNRRISLWTHLRSELI